MEGRVQPSGEGVQKEEASSEGHRRLDIVQRLRDRAYSFKAPDPLVEEAATEIERLRRVLATQECDILKRSLLELIQKWNSQVLLDNSLSGNNPKIGCPVTEPMPAFVSGSGSVTPISHQKNDEKRVFHDTIREEKDFRSRPEWEAKPDENNAADGRTVPLYATPQSPSTPGEGTVQTQCIYARNGALDSRETVQQEPVAWANEDDDGIYEAGTSQSCAQYVLDRAQNGNYSHRNPRIVPLYRSPQPTLTDEEREAIRVAVEVGVRGGPLWSHADTLGSLWERTK